MAGEPIAAQLRAEKQRREDVRRFARNSRPQQKVGSVRGYGCDYTSARLLYWAYYVPR